MKEGRKVFLLLNGEVPNTFPDLSSYDFICATDGAYDSLQLNQIVPDLICGDFDSISTLAENTEVIETPNQDLTDFEKCLEVLFERDFRSIDVYGGSGKEQDHFLGNLHSALVWKDRLDITFFDDNGRYQFISTHFEMSNIKNKMVSLFPFPKAIGIQTKGLQYPLTNEDLAIGTRIGIRNNAISDRITIQFTEGNLIVFISH